MGPSLWATIPAEPTPLAVTSLLTSDTVTVPPVPFDPPRVDGARATFTWQGNAALLYQLQIARDEWFHDLVLTKQMNGNFVAADDMPKGFYFARIRAIRVSSENQVVEALTPWSVTRNIDVYAPPLNLMPRP